MKKKLPIIVFALILSLSTATAHLFAQQSSDTATTKIGNPPTIDSGWPAAGRITQGPQGPSGHAGNNLVALDIANIAGTPIYATFEGTARAYDCTNRGECSNARGGLGNWVMLLPDAHPGAEVLFGHLQAVEIQDNTRVKPGDLIGYMGYTGYVLPPGPGGTHLHYEFRGLPMAPPYIPEAIIPETCGTCSPLNISTGGQ